jgi:hypothetical protein
MKEVHLMLKHEHLNEKRNSNIQEDETDLQRGVDGAQILSHRHWAPPF